MVWGSFWSINWAAPPPLGPFQLIYAKAIETNTMRATFSLPPAFYHPLRNGDGSALKLWALTRVDKGERITPLFLKTVPSDLYSIDLIIAERWGNHLSEYQLQVSTELLESTGNLNLELPGLALFSGISQKIKQTERREKYFDLLNTMNNPSYIHGGLEVGSGGDYAIESGISLVRKQIIRGIIIAQGSWLQLADVEWGLGIKDKESYTSADLATLRKQIKNQVLQEPEVIAASIQVSIGTKGILRIIVKAKTRFGDITIDEPIGR